MMRQLSLIMVGAALGAGTVGVVSHSHLLMGSGAVAATPETYRQLSLFGDIFERVRTDYVEKPNEGKLIESAVNGMLTSLDPHSSYMDAKAHRDMQVQTSGAFGGLGIEVTMEEQIIKVVTPIDDTPAAKAGILSGDIITHIDGESVQGLSLNQAVERMRGPVKSTVKLKVVRKGAKEPLEFAIVRDVITIRSVRFNVEDDVGYIRVTTFNQQTLEGVQNALKKLATDIGAEKLKGFVVDLRNNPGGLLDQSIGVVDAFLDKGEIVSTRGRNANDTQRFNAKPGDLANGKPVVVLVNGGSASASEIVAGALQDHKRATIIGTRSFGKGSVQTIIPIGSQGAIRLTTARYYTPSGRSIQAKGIDPDIVVLQEVPDELKGKDETKGEAALRGHLKGEGQEGGGSSAYVPADRTKDTQLVYALDLLRGKIQPPKPEDKPKETEKPKAP